MGANYLFIFYLTSCLFSVGFPSTFNYEIGARVEEKIADYLLLVSKASAHPNTILQAYANSINLADPLNDASPILFPSIEDYGSYVSSLYIGLETGIYYAYSVDTSQGISFAYVKYSKETGKAIRKDSLDLHTNGKPRTLVITNSTYNCNGRPWYIEGKLKQIPLWSKPYLNTGDLMPVITFVKPIFNQSINGVLYNFTGLTAADIFLTDINTFLQNTYENTDNRVFIIDSNTGNLIGNSWGASTSVTVGTSQNFVVAAQSTDSIISGSTNKLIKNDYSEELIIYNDMYLQCSLYTDPIEGVAWYIVVLSPAVLEVDHVAPGTAVFGAVIAIASIAIFCVLIASTITIIYWKSRMMQLTQPFFTLLVLGGCLLLCISCMVFLGKNTSNSCAARAFLFNLALTLAFAPLLIKCWRVYILFVKSWKVNVLFHGTQNKLITIPMLMVFVISFLLVDIIIAAVTLFGVGSGTDPYSTTLLTSNGAYAELTYCGFHDNNTFFYAELVYKLLQVVISSYLVFSIRNVADAVAGTKVLMGIVYNTAFIGALILGISRSVSNIGLVIMCITVGICFCVVVTCLLLVVPVMYRILVIGDKEAAAEVIDEMFRGKLNDGKPTNSKTTGQTSQIVVEHRASNVSQLNVADRNKSNMLGLGNASNKPGGVGGGGGINGGNRSSLGISPADVNPGAGGNLVGFSRAGSRKYLQPINNSSS